VLFRSMANCNRKIVTAAVAASVASAASALASGTCASVPERMLLSASMKSANLQKSSMVPFEFHTDPVSGSQVLKEFSEMVSAEMIDRHMGEYGSLCFVVRRPG